MKWHASKFPSRLENNRYLLKKEKNKTNRRTPWQLWPLVRSTLPYPGKITITPGELSTYKREGEKINLFDSYNPFLCILVSDDIKHIWSIPIGDTILNLCIFTQIGVIGFNPTKRSPRWCRFRRAELVGAWKSKIKLFILRNFVLLNNKHLQFHLEFLKLHKEKCH